MLNTPSMPAWGDQQISRFTYRVGLFQRRGQSPKNAEAFADRLAFRDYERDDRRACLECESMQRGGRCFVASQRRMPGVSQYLEVIPRLLQRCHYFTFQKP